MYLKYLKFQVISLLNIHTDQFSMYISDELVLIKNVDFYFPGHFKINAIKKIESVDQVSDVYLHRKPCLKLNLPRRRFAAPAAPHACNATRPV